MDSLLTMASGDDLVESFVQPDIEFPRSPPHAPGHVQQAASASSFFRIIILILRRMAPQGEAHDASRGVQFRQEIPQRRYREESLRHEIRD